MLPDIICHHVLPALPACDEASHIAYLALIISSGLTAPEALNASLSSKIISKLKAHGKVVTNHGIKQLEEAFLHLPVNLGNKVLPLPCWVHMHACACACECPMCLWCHKVLIVITSCSQH